MTGPASVPELVAEAYRRASLVGAKMVAAAPVLESIRDAGSGFDRPYTALERAERHAAAADDDGLIKALVRLCEGLRDAVCLGDGALLRDSFARSSEEGWRAWRRAFAAALADFRLRHCVELTREVSQHVPVPDDVAQIAGAAEPLIEQDWGAVYGTFVAIAASDDVAPRDRCKAFMSAAQVQIHIVRDAAAARRHIDAARALCPDDGRVAAVEGELHLKDGERAAAIERFEEAVRISPERADGYIGMGDVLFEGPEPRDPESAEQWYRKCLQCEGGLAAYEKLIGVEIGRSSADEGARDMRVRALFERVARASPEQGGELLFTVGSAYARARFWPQALRYLDEALGDRGAPRRALMLSWRASVHIGMESYEAAERDLLDVLSLGREAAEALALTTQLIEAVGSRRGVSEAERIHDATLARLGARADDPGLEHEKESLRRALATLWNEAANARYSAQDFAAAIDGYRRALALGPDAVISANLAGAWESHEAVPLDERLAHAVEAMRDAAAADEAKYAAQLERLEQLRRLAPRCPIALHRTPEVDPIVVEVASDIGVVVGDVAGIALRPEASEQLTTMRSAVRERYGVELPGVRVRMSSDGMPDGRYVILLHEVPLASGQLDTAPAIEPLITRLRAAVEQQLAQLLGVDDVHSLLAAAGEALLERVTAQPGALGALTAVLRALLAERVSIAAMPLLCERFLVLREQGAQPAAIVEALRALPEVRSSLPGNGEGETVVAAGRELEERVRRAIDQTGRVAILAMTFEDVQKALAAVRAEVGSSKPAAVLTDDSEVRPHLRKLIELDFPDVAVLARGELPSERGPRIAGTIRLAE
jgi:tetratricopeptide (TPR) repeat protein